MDRPLPDAPAPARRMAADNPAEAAQAAAAAVDFRGDLTLELRDGSTATGYVHHADASEYRLFVAGEAAPRTLPAAAVAAVVFSGTDAAAGKSWEHWLERVAEAERTGKLAELYPERLDGPS